MKVGFIGLGLMGQGMATNLLKAGHEVIAFDIDPQKVKSLSEAGAKAAPKIKDLVFESEVIMSSLPGPAVVKEVYLGPGGVVENLQPGQVIIDLSTVDPNTTRLVYSEVVKKGASSMDAPVSGGPKEAAEGTLTIIVGGDQEVFQKYSDLLKCLGKNIHYAGGIGSGNIVKLINNVLSMGNVLLAAEAFVLGVKAGVDGQTLFNIIKTSGGRSHHLEKRFPNVLRRNFEPGFTVELAKKDLGLALEMAQEVGVPLLTTGLIYQLYTTWSATGNGKKDCVSIINLFESWANVEVRGSDFLKITP